MTSIYFTTFEKKSQVSHPTQLLLSSLVFGIIPRYLITRNMKNKLNKVHFLCFFFAQNNHSTEQFRISISVANANSNPFHGTACLWTEKNIMHSLGHLTSSSP